MRNHKKGNPFTVSALALLSLLASSAGAQDTSTPRQIVRTPDGLNISVQDWGHPELRPLVLIHGLLQSHLSWIKQTNGALAKRFHLITYDLRGHGESDCPTNPKFYRSGLRWAQELESVIKATHVSKPILVGWSLGGNVISDYLSYYGSSQIGGIVYLDSFIKLPEPKDRPGSALIESMASADLKQRISARGAFLHACFWNQPSPEDFASQLAFNMITPPKVLLATVTRSFDYDKVARKTLLPVLVLQGEHDRLSTMVDAHHTKHMFPHASLVVIRGVGHASFFEDPKAFEKALENWLGAAR